MGNGIHESLSRGLLSSSSSPRLSRSLARSLISIPLPSLSVLLSSFHPFFAPFLSSPLSCSPPFHCLPPLFSSYLPLSPFASHAFFTPFLCSLTVFSLFSTSSLHLSSPPLLIPPLFPLLLSPPLFLFFFSSLFLSPRPSIFSFISSLSYSLFSLFSLFSFSPPPV